MSRVSVFASAGVPGSLVVSVHGVGVHIGAHLTPDEARGLAQRLLKEAAEVEFAGKLHDEAAKP